MIGIRSAAVRDEMALMSPGRQIKDMKARFVRRPAEIDETDDVAMAYRAAMPFECAQCEPYKTRVRIISRRAKRRNCSGIRPEDAQGQRAATFEKVTPGNSHDVSVDPSCLVLSGK